MKSFIQLMRPHQYVKNLFVFAPMLFAFKFSADIIVNAIVVFMLFSLLASSVYIFNDIMDTDEDRQHPTKKYRPIASGSVSIKTAYTLSSGLMLASLIISAVLNIELFYVLIIYLVLNVLYTIKLKHVPIIDIFIISTGFVLRLFAGNTVLDQPLSMWIIIMTFLLALFLALAKRRDDVILSLNGQQTRKNIDGYNFEFVNAGMVLMAGVVIVAYLLYTVSPSVTEKFNTDYLYLTSFFVILGIMRYMQITFVEENSGSPTKIVLKDRFMQITILLWLVSFITVVKI